MSAMPPSDIAYRLLRLEQQLESYQRLHEEELGQIRRTLSELKEEILSLEAKKQALADMENRPAE